MYTYAQQSPGVAQSLPNHHDQTPWSRSRQTLGPQSSVGVGPPPSSPGYAIYTNGSVNPLHHHPHLGHPQMQHHHQTSLNHYPSPPNGHQQHTLSGSPAALSITPHWQQQLLKCETIRSSRSPFHRARASALASRNAIKSAIPITNPNAIKPLPEIEPAVSTPSNDATSHPSSTVAPIAEANRPATTQSENTWNSLDMGGVNIKNLPPTSGLFSFPFLTNLYLNHNALSSIPAEISKLRHLELLDLSGNGLMNVPPEIGMLTKLKELYLFDNHLSTIPPEFGTLHQLQTLGIEGNPLDPSLKALIQKEGTPAVIRYLRDSCPVPQPPPERLWHHLLTESDREQILGDPSTETFSLMSYNILCEKAATERLYGYTPSWALSWDYRKELILTEMVNYDADFLCLQEVDIGQYEDYFVKHLEAQGYEGVYWPKSRHKTMNETDRRLVDGCATFYKTDTYQLVEKHLIQYSAVAMQRQDFKKTDDMFNRVLGRDHIAVVCLMENKHTGSRLVVANTHIFWDPNYCDVKLVQVGLLIDELQAIADDFAKYPPRPPKASENGSANPKPPNYADGTKIPLVIACDLNSAPTSGVCEYLGNGTLAPNHADFMSHTYGRYTSDGMKHKFNLKSAYAGIADPLVTNYTSSFHGMLDYIWYSASSISLNAVLGGVDRGYLSKVVGFPNAHFPSDHVCIMGEFRLKPTRDNPPRSLTDTSRV